MSMERMMSEASSGEGPAAPSEMEGRLNAAVDRILANQPKDEALRILADAKKLRLNFSNVAREVPCSRTLIGFESCPYPNVRGRILALMTSESARGLADQVARLKEEVAMLNTEIQARDTAYAELVIRVATQQRGRSPSGKPLSPRGIQERRSQMQLVAKAPSGGGPPG